MTCEWEEGDRALLRYKNGKRVHVIVVGHHPFVAGWVNVKEGRDTLPVKTDWLERPRRRR